MELATHFPVRRVAVLGAGVMGAQIAALLGGNAEIPVLLFDLAAKGPNPNALIENSIQALKKLKPAPIGRVQNLTNITPANYDQDLEELRSCDLIIEAISERMDWKTDLYTKIAPYISEKAWLVTNTSGLSISTLAEVLPSHLRSHFCGVHFFNPPRYMSLIEIIPAATTNLNDLAYVESFLVTYLGKNIVYAKDTPNFIANRVGVFSMLASIHYAEKFGLGMEVVDQITGPLIGRPKSATLRTADVVGLDTLAHTVKTMADNLPQDPWHHFYTTPHWIEHLIETGRLGQKTRAGVYQKQGDEISVYDLKENIYRPATSRPNAAIIEILKMPDPKAKIQALHKSELQEAKFLWASLRELFHYSACHLDSIADSVRDVDLAMRWGFGWQFGPFETWQASGWQQIATWIEEDIAAGKTLSKQPLPAWVKQADFHAYTERGAFSAKTHQHEARTPRAVYQRQWFRDSMPGEHFAEGKTIFETDAARLWSLHDDVAILSFKTKMNVIGTAVLDAIQQAVEKAEAGFSGLVIWQRHGDHFSAGANLNEFVDAVTNGRFSEIDQTLNRFQQACLAVRNALVPTVAATKGYVLGGGCELMLHCARVVAHFESYVGLVEAGVGLLPAGGGCKEMALRAALNPLGVDAYLPLEGYFKNIAMATAAESAAQARDLGYLRSSDVVVMHANELLHVAHENVRALSQSAYRPPLINKIPVLGREGIARMQMLIVNMRVGNFISEQDALIAGHIAHVLCGGEVEPQSLVDEAWLLRLEREAFVELVKTAKTQARIQAILKTGKPLRN